MSDGPLLFRRSQDGLHGEWAIGHIPHFVVPHYVQFRPQLPNNAVDVFGSIGSGTKASSLSHSLTPKERSVYSPT